MPEPEASSLIDPVHGNTAERRLDADAEADYRAGRTVPHAKVRIWLAKLANGDKVPPPGA